MVTNIKSRFIILAGAFLLLASSVSSVHAGFVLDNLYYGASVTNHYNDDSLEHVIGKTAGSLAIGDVLEGIFTFGSIGVDGGTIGIDRVNAGAGTGNAEVTGYFRTKVLDIQGGPGNYLVYFGPDAGSAFTAQYGDGAMAVMYEDTSPDYFTLGTIAQGIASATDGSLVTAIGFTGAGGTAADGEGWVARPSTLSITPTTLGFSIGSYFANLNLINQGGSAQFDNISFLNSQGSFFSGGELTGAPTTPTQFVIDGQVFSRPTNQIPAGGFPIRDSADFRFQANSVVPEPASMLVWAGIGLAGTVGGMMRRRRVTA